MAKTGNNYRSTRNSEKNPDIEAELNLMRQRIRMIRDQVNETLDEMLDQVNRLLPPEEDLQHIKFKNFTRKDWHNFLES